MPQIRGTVIFMKQEAFNFDREQEIMNFLQQKFGPEVFSPGFERTRDVYGPFKEHFKNSQTKIIIIAGTNGKGQTAHTLGSFLQLEQKSFALWTSPHILSIRERFSFGSSGHVTYEVTYDELAASMKEAELMMERDLQKVRISFYEFLFLVFLILAKKQKHLDCLILEVGLGGRLDAVNHFDADCTCITSISRDHQGILGSRYDQILAEKIAVTRKNVPLYTNFKLQYLQEKTKDYIEKNNVIWKPINSESEKVRNYFEENQLMAWELFKFLINDTQRSFSQAISNIPTYKGRREIMTFQGKSLIFIGAHNTDGIRKMIQHLDMESELFSPEKVLVSFSQRPKGEAEVMLKSLVEYFKNGEDLVLTSFDHPKAMMEVTLRDASLKINKGMLNFVSDWKAELKNSKSNTVLICGSYYFIGEVQRFILS